ncbi:Thyrostimulin alpha-2 subunit [Lamellibrachia satsuma]|nr:Thyrostimulin alpha-2 subunit [Lamellibrachia satsuma]
MLHHRHLAVLLLCVVFFVTTSGQQAWETPGCHRLGNTRRIYIPGCVAFHVTTNACRGFCTSFAFPSTSSTLHNNPLHVITSRAECCTIDTTHDVTVSVRCLKGYRKFTFKSAASCSCAACRHS